MPVSLHFKKTRSEKILNIILPVFEGGVLGTHGKALDKKNGGFIAHALSISPKFKGKHGETLTLLPPPSAGLAHIVLIGLGKAKDLTPLKAESAGGALWVALSKTGLKEAAFLSEDSLKPETQAHIANGLKLRAYNFDRYKSKKTNKDTDNIAFQALEIVSEEASTTKKSFETLDHVTQGVFMARDLVNMPPNDLYPESYAKIIQNDLKPLGIEVEIFDEKKLEKLGMHALLAVGQGSTRESRLVVLRWNGLDKKDNKNAPIAFVGKGVTFDSGGISLKPGAGMDEMKMDMGGSAAVVGLIKSLALQKSKSHVVGIVGLVENMPAGNAYRPADILTSYSGKTIEILNTDAEGRLVLADCLTYVQKTYKPKFVIDLATLTGAILVALGHEYCGTFSNDETLWKQLEKSSALSGEKLWRMPLDEAWKKEVESDIADVRNTAKSGRNAGSCTAAGFLQHFIEDGTIWAHMDIAGTAWQTKDLPTTPKFGSGFGVRVLNTLVSEYYES